MTVNNQLRRASERLKGEANEVPIPVLPSNGARRVAVVIGAALIAVSAVVALVWLSPFAGRPGPAVDNPAVGDVAMVREWLEGALAGQFDEIASLTYGESGEPEALAQLARTLHGYQSQYGEPDIGLAPFQTDSDDLAFTCMTLGFGDFELTGGVVVRSWPELGRKLWEFRSGMTGCSGETSVTTTLPAVPTEIIPIDAGPLEGRVGHTVVWTGAEVIVWGGHAGNLINAFNDGAAFNPDTNEWRSIEEAPLDGMTWHFAAWSGAEMLVVGTSGAAAYDPAADRWRTLPSPPVQIHRVDEGISDLTEYAWSGSHLYVWNPIGNEFVRLAPFDRTWEVIEGPGLEASPAKVVAKGDRVLVFGTRWPSSLAGPATYELFGAELTDDGWVKLPAIDFLTDSGANVADPGTASFVGELVLVWGDPSTDSGDARLLHPDGSWSSAPPPPIDGNLLHPRPILLDDGRVLALSEGGNAAIWEPQLNDWTSVGTLPGILGAREAAWTGRDLIAWSGGESWRWSPPPPP